MKNWKRLVFLFHLYFREFGHSFAGRITVAAVVLRAPAVRVRGKNLLPFPFLQQLSHSGNLLKQPGYQCPRDAREQNPYQRPGKYPQRFTEERPCRLCFR